MNTKNYVDDEGKINPIKMTTECVKKESRKIKYINQGID